MTLQDDIQKARRDWIRQDGIKPSIVELFAAGLERENIIIPKSELPKVDYTGTGYRHSIGTVHEEWGSKKARKVAREWLAIADAMDAKEAARETAEARLQERRDELIAELTGIEGERYNSIAVGLILRNAVDRIIELEAR